MSGKTCQFCGKPLWRLRLGGDGDFCSREHRYQYQVRKGLNQVEESSRITTMRRRQEQPRLSELQRAAGAPTVDSRRFFVWRDSTAWRALPIALPPTQMRASGTLLRRQQPLSLVQAVRGRVDWAAPLKARRRIPQVSPPPHVPSPRGSSQRALLPTSKAADPRPRPTRPRTTERSCVPALPIGASNAVSLPVPALRGAARGESSPRPPAAVVGECLRVVAGPAMRLESAPRLPRLRPASEPSGMPSAEYALVPYDVIAQEDESRIAVAPAPEWLQTDLRLTPLHERCVAAAEIRRLRTPFEVRPLAFPPVMDEEAASRPAAMMQSLPALKVGRNLPAEPPLRVRGGENSSPVLPMRPKMPERGGTQYPLSAKRLPRIPVGLVHPGCKGRSSPPDASGFDARQTSRPGTYVPRPCSRRETTHRVEEFLRPSRFAALQFDLSPAFAIPHKSRKVLSEVREVGRMQLEQELYFIPPTVMLQGNLAELVDPACGAPVRLEEHFNSGLARWSESAADWKIDLAGVRVGSLALFTPTIELIDYEFEFLARLEGRALHWVFRAADHSTYYMAALSRSGFEVSAVIDGVAGSGVSLPLANPLPVKPVLTVAVRVTGDQFQVSVEGVEVAQWSDSSIPNGGIGFLSAEDRTRLYWVRLASLNRTQESSIARPVASRESSVK